MEQFSVRLLVYFVLCNGIILQNAQVMYGERLRSGNVAWVINLVSLTVWVLVEFVAVGRIRCSEESCGWNLSFWKVETG